MGDARCGSYFMRLAVRRRSSERRLWGGLALSCIELERPSLASPLCAQERNLGWWFRGDEKSNSGSFSPL
jgi:hypothetical protein